MQGSRVVSPPGHLGDGVVFVSFEYQWRVLHYDQRCPEGQKVQGEEKLNLTIKPFLDFLRRILNHSIKFWPYQEEVLVVRSTELIQT